MSRDASVRLPLGAEERTFRLALGQQRAIEEKCDAGLPELAARLGPMVRLAQLADGAQDRGRMLLEAAMAGALGRWRVDDYREVIYQGLIGGGDTPTMAGVIVRSTVDTSPPLEMAVLAFQIVLAALLGPEDEPVAGEPKGAKTPPARPRSRATRPAGPTSTAPAP